MNLTGQVKIGRRTKDLVKRLSPGDIAVIFHEDLDMVAADNLVTAKPKAVVNCHRSISGKYVNRGPCLLQDAAIPIIDNVGEDWIETVKDGDTVTIRDGEILLSGRVIASGPVLDQTILNEMNMKARENLEEEIEKFATNTLSYLKKEKGLLYSRLEMGDLKVDFRNRQVLVVVRGPEFAKDLNMLLQYIEEQHPVIIAVDGAADAIIESGHHPDIILGDMDSVTDNALKCGAMLIVHAYQDGRAPGLERLDSLSLKGYSIPSIGTSEDLALLLAHEHGAELIVVVGSHFSMEEFLSKNRSGMASTFLTRLRVGSILVDAKGISKLYQNKVQPKLLVFLIIAALFPVAAIFFVSPLGPLARQFVRLLRLLMNL